MNKLEKLYLILFNYPLYKDWRDRVKGKTKIDIRKGPGYYIPLGFIGSDPIGKTEEWDMVSGKKAKLKLISYTTFRDPSDMIDHSEWQFLGYVGEKMLSEMSFEEYLSAYRVQHK